MLDWLLPLDSSLLAYGTTHPPTHIKSIPQNDIANFHGKYETLSSELRFEGPFHASRFNFDIALIWSYSNMNSISKVGSLSEGIWLQRNESISKQYRIQIWKRVDFEAIKSRGVIYIITAISIFYTFLKL